MCSPILDLSTLNVPVASPRVATRRSIDNVEVAMPLLASLAVQETLSGLPRTARRGKETRGARGRLRSSCRN